MIITIKRGTTKTNIRHLLDRIRKAKKGKEMDAKKYCGVVSLNIDPLEVQKSLRDEWK